MEAIRVWFDTTQICVEFTGNKIGKMPLSWFPRLLNASETDRYNFELWADRSWIHWEQLGEDLSVEGFFTFKKDTTTV